MTTAATARPAPATFGSGLWRLADPKISVPAQAWTIACFVLMAAGAGRGLLL